MRWNRAEANEPRAVYHGAPNTITDVPPIPKHLLDQPTDVQIAWVKAQTSPPPPLELDEDALRAVEVSVDEAFQAWHEVRYLTMDGPEPPGYRGSELLTALPPGSPAIAQALTMERCKKYEAQLQAESVPLRRAVHDAYEAAERAAWAEVAPQIEANTKTAAAAANDPRAAGRLNLPRVERGKLDLSDYHKAQAAVDRVANEIHACRARYKAAQNAVNAVLTKLSELLISLLWIGPRGDVGRPDWRELYKHYDELCELIGVTKADEVWQKAETRWK